jgi:cytochrome c oxidase subunit 2
MIGTVYVMEADAYQAWLSSGGLTGSMSARGEQLFQQLACSTCHLADGTGRGPSLVGAFGSQVKLSNGQTVVADESYVRESILTPQAKIAAGFQNIMPTFQGQLSEEQILQLVAYVRSLAPAGQQQGAGAQTTSGPTTGGVPPQQQRMNPIAPTSERQGNPAPQAPPAGNTGNANRQQ